MATYITLSRWTTKGAENVKDSSARLDKVKEAAKAAGGEMKAFYLTMGEYDLVIVWDFPDDKACAKFALGVLVSCPRLFSGVGAGGLSGNVRPG